MDEHRQQTAVAHMSHRRTVTTAEVEVDRLKQSLSMKDDGAAVKLDELRDQFNTQARKVIQDRDAHIRALTENVVNIQLAAS